MILLPVQYVSSQSSISSSFFISFDILIDKVAAVKSNLGIDVY